MSCVKRYDEKAGMTWRQKLLSNSAKATDLYNRRKKAREQLAKKGSRPGKPWVHRLGYNNATVNWTGHEDFPVLSGSSLNRKPRKPEKRKKTPPQLRTFSRRSRAKCRDKTTAFHRAAGKDKTFCTLTFVTAVDDQKACRIWNKLRTVLKKENPKFEFIRIAERQWENVKFPGNIHFHCMFNQRIPIRRLNALWVLQQYNAGLRGYSETLGREITMKEMRLLYRRDLVHTRFNPADIRKAYSVNSLAQYLTKYVTKQSHEDTFGCLVCHCSRKVSRLFTRQVVDSSPFAYLRSFKINARIDWETGEAFEPNVYHSLFFSTVQVHNKGRPLKFLRMLEQANKWIMEDFIPEKITRITPYDYNVNYLSHESIHNHKTGRLGTNRTNLSKQPAWNSCSQT